MKSLGGWPIGTHAALALLALAGVALWVMSRKGAAVEAGAAIGAAAVDAGAGVVLGVGDALGVPRTDLDACAAARANGDLWAASFACPAGDFIGYAWDRATGTNTGSVSGSW